jgi:hypothetical protein
MNGKRYLDHCQTGIEIPCEYPEDDSLEIEDYSSKSL